MNIKIGMLDPMKNVLIVSFYFSESENIGSHRSRGLAENLSKFGWHPIIITQQNSTPFNCANCEIIEVPFCSKLSYWKRKFGYSEHSAILKPNRFDGQKYSIFDTGSEIIRFILFYPDEANSWISPTIEKIQEILKNEKISAIISTSSPISSHFIACNIKRRFNIPWIADFRDLWSQNHYLRSKIWKARHIINEKITISNANILTTVSAPLANKLENIHHLRAISIMNGYNRLDLNLGEPLDQKFSIIHTGRLYEGRRDPEPLFRAIHNLILTNKISPNEISVNFYGCDDEWLKKCIERYQLQDIVSSVGIISRDESIKKQRSAQLLLLLTWNSSDESGVYTGKIFEYIAAKRPIFLMGCEGGVASQLIMNAGIGKVADNKNSIEEILMGYYIDFKKYGYVPYNEKKEITSTLDQERMARQFAELLDDLTS
ncbi:MAG: hypothetical protein A4E32_01189 [Methanomassiliicoccales archaeon PtaU1.Bin124]|nr:MAG: hypothetical protein A4E32_01189 [Methanomassiliicoccales archaeon PtaU1.Bin124]